MINDSNLILSPELLSQESEIYRRQKILFVLIDILFVSSKSYLLLLYHRYFSDFQFNYFNCFSSFI